MANVSQFRGKGYNFNDNLDNVLISHSFERLFPLESTPSSGKGTLLRGTIDKLDGLDGLDRREAGRKNLASHPYYTEKGTFVKSLGAFFLHFFSLLSALEHATVAHSLQSTIAQLADAYLGHTQHPSHLTDGITPAQIYPIEQSEYLLLAWR